MFANVCRKQISESYLDTTITKHIETVANYCHEVARQLYLGLDVVLNEAVQKVYSKQ